MCVGARVQSTKSSGAYIRNAWIWALDRPPFTVDGAIGVPWVLAAELAAVA